MSGTVARTEDGKLFFIPEELHDYLAVTPDVLEAAEADDDDVEGFAIYMKVDGITGGLSLPKLDQQWSRFGPGLSMRASDQCTETGDSGTMGCPG